jgi:hypothetical protein
MEITNSIYKKSPVVGPGRSGLFLYGPGFFSARAGLSKTARAGPGGPCANTNFQPNQNQFYF